MEKKRKDNVELDDNIKTEAAAETATETVAPQAETEDALDAQAAGTPDDEKSVEKPAVKEKKRKKGKELSGAYWYCIKEDADLLRNSQIRSLVHLIALMLQLVVLALPQEGLEYVTKFISSYALVYMWAVFIMIGVMIYVLVMDFVRNKIQKRIPVEHAPKHGFKRRAFLSAEIAIAINALIFVLELSFVCIYFDGIGLLGMFLALAATGMAVWAREIEHLTLKDDERIEAPDEQSEENKQ